LDLEAKQFVSLTELEKEPQVYKLENKHYQLVNLRSNILQQLVHASPIKNKYKIP